MILINSVGCVQIARKVNPGQWRINFNAQVQNVIVVHHPSIMLHETEKKETHTSILTRLSSVSTFHGFFFCIGFASMTSCLFGFSAADFVLHFYWFVTFYSVIPNFCQKFVAGYLWLQDCDNGQRWTGLTDHAKFLSRWLLPRLSMDENSTVCSCPYEGCSLLISPTSGPSGVSLHVFTV